MTILSPSNLLVNYAMDGNVERVAYYVTICGVDPNQKHDVLDITALEAAAGAGHLEAVRSLLRLGANPNSPAHRGNSALHRALEYPIIVKLLIDSGASIGQRQEGLQKGVLNGSTVLERAIYKGLAETVRVLLNAGADPNERCGISGRLTPLMVAVEARQPEIVRALLDAGADRSLPDWFFKSLEEKKESDPVWINNILQHFRPIP